MLRIERPTYMDFLQRSKDRPIIKVVSGVRRCGKSTLFEMYREWLVSNGVHPNCIVSINFEELEVEHLRDYKILYEHLLSRLTPDQMTYIFLDEIQHVDQFEKVVGSLHVKRNVDMYITGSNAWFMSGDLATLLTGRYVELKMLPLSFSEYSAGREQLSDEPETLNARYADYCSQSSFPYAMQLNGNRKDIQEYLAGIYNSILLKDVVARLHISDVMMLESVIRFVFHNIGNLLSTTKIANTMTSEGRKIDQKTVEKYLRGLMDSLMLHQAGRFDIKGKQYLATLEKYYVADIGLRQYLLGPAHADQGHILENVVYLELLRRFEHVHVGHLPGGEVDFVVQNASGIQYYQVAASVLDTRTLQRELAPLQKTMDHYPKYLLTLDEIGSGTTHNGIVQMNALTWLLQ